MKGISLSNSTVVEMEELMEVALPEQTDTYIPVGHFDLAENVKTVAMDLLQPKGYSFRQETFGLAREGARLFGLYTFRNGNDEMGMSVAFRNSYDKSMRASLAIGAQVFICDNLMLSGDITVMRKHTKNVKEDLIGEIVQALYNCDKTYLEIQEDAARMKEVDYATEAGYRALGSLLGNKIITPTIANEAYRQWDKPNHDAFESRNAWSFYNALTEGAKKAPPHQSFETHKRVHSFVMSDIVVPELIN